MQILYLFFFVSAFICALETKQEELVKEVPDTRWVKSAVSGLNENKADQELELFPKMYSHKIDQVAVQNTTTLPPNFYKELREHYLGNFDALNPEQALFTADCWAKHKRYIDGINKGALAQLKVVPFAYSVEAGRCVSHYFKEVEYENSSAQKLLALKDKCFELKELGQFYLPIRLNRSHGSYLELAGMDIDPETKTLASIDLDSHEKLNRSFSSVKKDIIGNFIGESAFKISYRDKKQVLVSEITFQGRSQREPATDAEEFEGRAQFRLLTSDDAAIVVEVRIMQNKTKSWNEWQRLQSCFK